MSKFGDLIRGIKAAPAPEPVVEAPAPTQNLLWKHLFWKI